MLLFLYYHLATKRWRYSFSFSFCGGKGQIWINLYRVLSENFFQTSVLSCKIKSVVQFIFCSSKILLRFPVKVIFHYNSWGDHIPRKFSRKGKGLHMVKVKVTLLFYLYNGIENKEWHGIVQFMVLSIRNFKVLYENFLPS